MRFSARLAALLIAFPLLSACGNDEPTGILAGDLMSVAEQTAIEAALGTVAAALEEEGRTAEDSVLADFTRIAARLAFLHGRHGSVSISAPGAGSPFAGRAIYATADAGAAGPGTPRVHMVVAWEGLHTSNFTVRRALVMMSGDPANTGTFSVPATSQTAAARWVDFTSSTPVVYFNVDGNFTVGSPAFSGNCPGLPSSEDIICRTGRATIGGSWRGSSDDGVTTPTISWGEAVVPAFLLGAG